MNAGATFFFGCFFIVDGGKEQLYSCLIVILYLVELKFCGLLKFLIFWFFCCVCFWCLSGCAIETSILSLWLTWLGVCLVDLK